MSELMRRLVHKQDLPKFEPLELTLDMLVKEVRPMRYLFLCVCDLLHLARVCATVVCHAMPHFSQWNATLGCCSGRKSHAMYSNIDCRSQMPHL